MNRVDNRNDDDKYGIMLYQFISGDTETGTIASNWKSSTMEILSTSSAYDSALMFFIVNTKAVINFRKLYIC